MVNTEIRLFVFFAAKDGEVLKSQEKQDLEPTVAQIISSFLQNSVSNSLPTELRYTLVQFSSVAQSCPTLCNPMNCSTNSWSSPKLMSIESVMASSHLILCRPLLLPQIPPSIRVFSNESTLPMRWPKFVAKGQNPSNEHPGR